MAQASPGTHIPTAHEIAEEISREHPQTATSITNVYPTTIKEQDDNPPNVNLYLPQLNPQAVSGDIAFDAPVVNTGGELARHEQIKTAVVFAERGKKEENKIFETLHKMLDGSVMTDQEPGASHVIHAHLYLAKEHIRTQDLGDHLSGKKALYLAILASYEDKKGKKLYAEECKYYWGQPPLEMYPCSGHNTPYNH